MKQTKAGKRSSFDEGQSVSFHVPFAMRYLFRMEAGAGGTGAFPPENGAKFQETLLKGPVPRTWNNPPARRKTGR